MRAAVARLWPRSLFGRLVLAQVVYGVAVAIAFAAIAELTHSRFHLEATQRQALSWAADILARHSPLNDPLPATPQDAARSAYVLREIGKANPGATLYLLSPDGIVVATSLAREAIVRPDVDPAPIRSLLSRREALPILVADPAAPDVMRPFSVAPLGSADAPQGYLLMLLQGLDTSASFVAHASFLLSDSLALAAGVTVPALATALILLSMILRPVRRMSATLATLAREHLTPGNGLAPADSAANASELEQLNRQVEAMAQRIRELLQRLSDDDRALREMFASLSHDLRTPLMVIEDCLESVTRQRGQLSAEQVRETVASAAAQSHSLARLVESVFELATLQRPEYRINPEPFVAAELVHDVAAKFAARASAHGVRLEVGGATSSSRVHADPMLIERVLDNLIDNAIRHAGATRISIELAETPFAVDILVRDDGVGLPPALQAALASGGSISGSASRSPRRGGLGLNIVRRILELHGSRLVAEAPPSTHGAAWVFSLTRLLPGTRRDEELESGKKRRG